MTLKRTLFAFLVAFSFCAGLAAQNSGSTPEAYMEEYRRLASSGTPGTSAYNALLNAYEGYSRRMSGMTADSPGYASCKAALAEIFPLLSDGAYHFASLNNQNEVLRFACAYIDLSLMSCMADMKCKENPTYPILANLAATNIYNRRDYKRSQTYFQAYLETTDMSQREIAFEGLARCYYEMKDYGPAAYVASQGMKIYPRNWNMLLVGIESCGHMGDDATMETMLKAALAIQPGHKGLLEYQGKMYERMKRYEDASSVFRRLYDLSPNSLDYAFHLAFDYYNAGTVVYLEARQSGSAERMRVARDWFSKAAPVLRDVLDNSPYAVNVAHALATCYSLTNDNVRLREANNTLAAMNTAAVGADSVPRIDLAYAPVTTGVPASSQVNVQDTEAPLLSDVDVNIPETGLVNKNTIVAVIANENYKNANVQNVEFARNDGERFAEYCNKVLGVPSEQIRARYDATLSEIVSTVKYLKTRTGMNPDKLDVIVYYAGHGKPDFNSDRNSCFLIPSDADGQDNDLCYSLDKLYAELDGMPARSVTVFLDACFSGVTRSGGMIDNARYVAKEVQDMKPQGRKVVFSAATGNQAAHPYKEKGHGFFTYFLLKSLQETRGDITLGELAERLRENVSNKVFDVKNAVQTPTVQASDALGSGWKTHKLTD